MKTVKKIVSVVLAVFMIVAMTVNAGATTSDLTGEDHSYKAYQIFKGTQTGTGQELGSITWGDGVDSAALLSAIQNDDNFKVAGVNIFASAQDAKAVAKALSENNTTAIAKEFAKKAYANKTGDGQAVSQNQSGMAAGYYLIVDVTELEASAENTLVNLAMVRVTSNGTLTIETKNSAPTLVKKVQEKNDSNASSSGNGSWQDGADYDIGDEVPFQLTATLPTHYADYDSYKLVFHDTLATGLTYTNITKVYATNSSGDTVAEYASGTDYTVTRDSQNLTFTFSNLKTATDADKLIAGSKIIVEYTAKLNENATVGSAGNSNEAYLEYSNNPNADGSDSLGKTPVDKVLVFTYKIIVTKHGEADQLLPGATFKLSKLTLNGESENYVEVTDKLTTNADGDTGASIFTFTGLDAGIYKLEETDAPDGYDKIEYPILFEISATYNAESQTPAFGSLTITDNTQSTNASIDEEERFSINNTDGSISTTVKDTKGGVLPTTGGMGTTIFTVCGIVLMLGASILLVTRKRMSR